jgi:hypothetical protein
LKKQSGGVNIQLRGAKRKVAGRVLMFGTILFSGQPGNSPPEKKPGSPVLIFFIFLKTFSSLLASVE